MKQFQGWSFPDRDTGDLGEFLHRQLHLAQQLIILTGRNLHTAVCGGAHIGVIPRAFASFFGTVLAFEPDHENWECLLKNCNGVKNIRAVNEALSDSYSCFPMAKGAQSEHPHYVRHGKLTGIGSVMLDQIGLMACDLLQLDVNGCELLALEGAADTIYKHRPLIAVEVNDSAARMGHTVADVDTWLAERHYQLLTTISPYDRVYKYVE